MLQGGRGFIGERYFVNLFLITIQDWKTWKMWVGVTRKNIQVLSSISGLFQSKPNTFFHCYTSISLASIPNIENDGQFLTCYHPILLGKEIKYTPGVHTSWKSKEEEIHSILWSPGAHEQEKTRLNMIIVIIFQFFMCLIWALIF